MTLFEQRVMSEVCTRHIERCGSMFIKSYQDFCKKWMYKDFTKTFEATLNHTLSAQEKQILVGICKNNESVADIANRLGYEQNLVLVTLNSIFDRLASVYTFKELYIGTEEFNKVLDGCRANIAKSLNSESKKSKIVIGDLGLSRKACRSIARYLKGDPTNITADYAVNHISNLLNVPSVGIDTAKHIINIFDNNGILCEKWKEEILYYG